MSEKIHSASQQSVYQFHATGLDGRRVNLSEFQGKVLLVVNTASQCGFTPQYAALEQLHEKYSKNGLEILGFPCNQFGEQEPGDAQQIANFCTSNYGVKFHMFDKIEVNGKNEHPLYAYLKREEPGALGSESIKWNFTKFLINRKGQVIKRYAPNVDPLELSSEIEAQLAEK